MDKTVLEFYGKGGKRAGFCLNELRFFILPVSLGKVAASLRVLKRMLLNRSWMGLFCFAKLSIETALGVHPIELDRDEYEKIIAGMIGFEPESLEGPHKIRINFSRRGPRAGDALAIFLQVAVLDQYCLEKTGMRGKVVVDAGANQGFFSIYAARLGAKKVYAFEPVRETWLVLRKIIQDNGLQGKIVPINMALGTKKEVRLSIITVHATALPRLQWVAENWQARCESPP